MGINFNHNIAENIYKDRIIRINPNITNEEWDYFKSGFKYININAKEVFVKPNQQFNKLGFIIKGLVRCYYLTKKGEPT
jgi:hypothetical protein